MSAPEFFVDQTQLADAYSDGCVTFLNDFEVLDCTTFTISGFSTPNALKFNDINSLTGGKEIITFCQPVTNPSFKLMVSNTATAPVPIKVEGFDSANRSLGIQTPTIGSVASVISINSTVVAKIEITTTTPTAGAIDDLTYTPTTHAIPTMQSWQLIIFGLLTLNLGAFFVKKKELV
jgi:hypothetical protein